MPGSGPGARDSLGKEWGCHCLLELMARGPPNGAKKRLFPKHLPGTVPHASWKP